MKVIAPPPRLRVERQCLHEDPNLIIKSIKISMEVCNDLTETFWRNQSLGKL